MQTSSADVLFSSGDRENQHTTAASPSSSFVPDVVTESSGAAFPDVWSVAKRAFCCRHESKGCSDATPPRRLVEVVVRKGMVCVDVARATSRAHISEDGTPTTLRNGGSWSPSQSREVLRIHMR